MQCTPSLSARATIAKTNEFVTGVRIITKTKRTPLTSYCDVQRGFGDDLVPYVLSGMNRLLRKLGFSLWMKSG